MTYILGNTSTAQHRLQLLNDITNKPFVDNVLPVLPKQGVRVLVVGCGSGTLEQNLSELFRDTIFVGIDINPDRIQEAEEGIKDLVSTNTFTYHCHDLCKLEPEDLGAFDIIISRFVLSHLPDPVDQFDRLTQCVRTGGYFVFEELASDTKEYKCHGLQDGYNQFVQAVKWQIDAQQCQFDTGLTLLEQLKRHEVNILSTYVSQPLLQTAEEKSILRLGLQEITTLCTEKMGEEWVNTAILALREFEKDPYRFGFYNRFVGVVAQIDK